MISKQNQTVIINHRLLLQAVYSTGASAISAWAQWRANIDFEDLDWISYQLLPSLHQNLIKHGVKDSLMPKMKGIQRLFWCKNQVLLPILEDVLRAFQQAEIQPILADDILSAFKDNSQRLQQRSTGTKLLSYLSLVIQITDIPVAVDILQQLGWHSSASNPVLSLQQSASLGFEREGKPTIILQTHLCHWCLVPDLMLEFCSRTVSVQIGDVISRTWDITDRLLYLAMQCNSEQVILVLSDWIWILQTCSTQIDWHRLSKDATKYRLLVPLQDLLVTLQDLQIALPDGAIEIMGASTNPIERWEYKIVTQAPPNRLARCLQLYAQHHRQVAISAGDNTLWSFARFLQERWQLDSVWQVPVQGLRRQLRVR